MNIRTYVNEQKRFVPKDCNWNELFKNGGYYSVELGELSNWSKTHEWCINLFGEEHYCWAGSTFWFESEEHAIWFKLCWG